MDDYISREAAKKAVCERCDYAGTRECVSCVNPAEAIPTADVKPVVRCKDCTHSRKGKESVECEKHRYAWNDRLRWVDDNDFCCWGVRKDGDGEGKDKGRMGLTEKSFLERMEYMGFYDSNKKEAIPAADVVPVRHGRWIRYGAEKWYCSECELTIETEEECLPNFCKDCGARMDGDGDA